MVESDVQDQPVTVKTELHNHNSLPKKAAGVKQLNFRDRLVDYGTDDEDGAEEPPPLRPASLSIQASRSQEATTEGATDTQNTTILSDAVVKIESPTDNVLKVCAFSSHRFFFLI
jgi:hypothetical protein